MATLKRLFSKQYSNDQVHFLKLVKQLNKERVTDSLKEELRSTYQSYLSEIREI